GAVPAGGLVGAGGCAGAFDPGAVCCSCRKDCTSFLRSSICCCMSRICSLRAFSDSSLAMLGAGRTANISRQAKMADSSPALPLIMLIPWFGIGWPYRSVMPQSAREDRCGPAFYCTGTGQRRDACCGFAQQYWISPGYRVG